MTYPTSKNLMAAFDPIDHRSPLPPIDIAPRKPITQERQKSFLELQADEAEASERIARGERMWEITRQLAHGTNVAGGTVWEVVAEPASGPAEQTVYVETQLSTDVFVQVPSYVVWSAPSESMIFKPGETFVWPIDQLSYEEAQRQYLDGQNAQIVHESDYERMRAEVLRTLADAEKMRSFNSTPADETRGDVG